MPDPVYSRIRELFLAVKELAPDERSAYLDQHCDDERVRAEVESILPHVGTPLSSESAHQLVVEFVAEEQAAHLPETIGQYRILKQIGEGGMGVVYLAEQESPQRQVALKVMRQGLGSEHARRRFEFEVSVLGQLHHPGIAQIFDAGIARIDGPDGAGYETPFFSMEFVEGEVLTAYVDRYRISVEGRIDLIARICDAVEHAHQKGVIHRDLKPGNILVDTNGQPKILDFGVARSIESDVQATMLTDAGQLIGTLAYMSPEQLSGQSEAVDTRSDVHALGVVFFELMAGRLPYSVSSAALAQAARIIQEQDAERLGTLNSRFRGDIETIAGKALEKEPERRYSTAAGFADDLRRCRSHMPIAARPASAAYQLRKFTRRHKGLVASFVITFLSLIAGVTTSTWFAYQANLGTELARTNAQRAERTAYRSHLSAATFAFSTGDFATTSVYLDRISEEHHDNWEYRYFRSRTDLRLVDWLSNSDDGGPSPALAFDSATNPVVVMAEQETIVVRDGWDGRELRRFSAQRVVDQIQVCDDASRVLTVDSESIESDPSVQGDAPAKVDRMVRVFDAVTGAQLFATRLTHSKERAWFSPDGERLALTSLTALTVYDVGSGDLIATFKNRKEMNRSDIDTAAFSRDSKRIAWFVGLVPRRRWLSILQLVDIESGEIVAESSVGGKPHTAVAFSDRGQIAAYSAQGYLSVFDEDLRIRSKINLEVASAIHEKRSGLCFLGENRVAVCGSDHIVRICDIDEKRQIYAVRAQGFVSEIRPSSDEKTLALSGPGAGLWALDFEPAHSVRHTSDVNSAVYSPDGFQIATCSDPDMRFIDAISGNTMVALRYKEDRPRLAGLSADGTRFVSVHESNTDVVRLRDLASGLSELRQNHSRQAPLREFSGGTRRWGWALSHDRRIRANSANSMLKTIVWNRIELRDFESGDLIRTIDAHDGGTIGIAFSRDDQRIASGGKVDGLVKVWSVTGELLASMPGHRGEIASLDFSPDGKRLVSVGRDRVVRIWDAEVYEIVAEFSGHGGLSDVVAFSPDGTQFLTGCVDDKLRIWDTVPRYERRRQARELAKIEVEIEPKLRALFEEFKTPAEVIEALRQDPTLDERSRNAAFRWVLKSPAVKALLWSERQ